jgi:hypothetical protein
MEAEFVRRNKARQGRKKRRREEQQGEVESGIVGRGNFFLL